MSKLTKRITAMLLSGMLVFGSVPGAVFAADAQEDPGQTSAVAEEVGYEDMSEAPASAGETSEESYSEEASAEEAAQYYTVTLDANGGYFENELDDAVGDYVERAEVIEKKIPVGGIVAAIPVFSDQDRQTMLFAGWSVERDGELISEEGEEYIPVENCVLYAVWKAADEGVEQENTAQETDAAEEAEDIEAVESEPAQDYENAEAVEENETGSEGTDEAETAQEFEETEEESDTAQETEEDGYVEYDTASADAYSESETENEQDAAPAQDADYSDAEEEESGEESSVGSAAEEETNPDLGDSSEEEETVKEDAVNGVVASGTCGDNLTWTYDYNEQTLTIRGTGEMTDCEYLDLDGSEFGDNIISYAGYFRSYCKSVIIEDGVTTIMDCAFSGWGSLESVAIPNSIVTIGDYAFRNCTSLTSVTIPDSVTSIGDYAFDFCTSLTSVAIPNSVTSIGRGVFYDCRSLTSVTIPDSVTSISESAFSECSNLESVEIPDSVTSIGGYAFNGCSRLNSVTIPDSVTSIGGYAFQRCTYLKSMTIGNSVTSIGDYAFFNCNSLTSVTIPDSVTSIGDYAFRYCPALTSVTIPNSLTDIGKEVFSCCSNLTNVTLQKGLTYIGESMFEDCRSLTSVTIPESVYCIARKAFFGCENLTSVTIPGNANIGDRAFETYPEVLTSLTVCGSVTSSGLSTFRTCRSLNSVIIQDGVTSIGNSAFSSFDNLTSVTIPNSVKSIGDSAFSGCTNLQGLTIPYSVTSIGNSAFSDCTNLINMTIPTSVTSIGNSAYSGCTGLKSVKIPASVTMIGANAFSDCTSLANVTIPTSVTSIGSSAFSDCVNLTSVTIPNSVTSIGRRAFSGCTSLTNVTIPDGVTSIGDYAFSDCSSLTSVTIPGSVTSIGKYAFSNCSSLTTIYFKGNAPSIDSNAFNNVTATFYYPTNDSTWTEEVRQSFGGNITWESYDPSSSEFNDPDEVEISQDILQCFTDHRGSRQIINNSYKWAFSNTDEFPERNGYYISRNDFVKLFRGLSNTDRHRIIGEIRPDARINPLRDEGFWTDGLNVDGLGIPGTNTDNWEGSCAGMSTLAMLINNGELNASDIDSSANNVSEIASDYNAVSAINFYHVQQDGFYQNQKNYEFHQLGVDGGQEAQLALCESLGQKANEEGTVFELTYQWFSFDRDDNRWVHQGHTVLGYGLETNIEQIYNDITYTKRILIYDVGNPQRDLEFTDLYYNDEGQFCIPGRGVFSTTIEMYENETDNGKLVFATDDAKVLNTVDYATGENQKQSIGLTVMYVLTRLEDNTKLIIEDIRTGEIWRILRTGSTSDNSNRRLTIFGRNSIHKVSASNDEYTIVLPNPTHEYRIISESTGIDCMVSKGDYLAEVKTDSPGELVVGDRGEVEVKTNSKGDFSITMVSDEFFESTEVDQINIVGSDVSSFKSQSDENGIAIKADNDGSLNVYGRNDDDSFSETIDNSQSEVIIDKDGVTPLDKNIVKIDANGGVINSELDDSTGQEAVNAESVTKKVTIGEYVLIPARHVQSNNESLHLAGWSLSPGGDPVITFNESYKPDGDCTLYAVWKRGTLAGTRLYGDLNNNARIDIGDGLCIQRHISAYSDSSVRMEHPDWIMTGYEYEAADVNHDAVISENDLTLIHQSISAQNKEETQAEHPDWIITETFDFYSFDGTEPISIAEATVTGLEAKTYTGKEITQALVVKIGDTILEKDTDYTVAYSNNTNVGTATVTITGKGNYTGTVSKTFTISAASIADATVSGISNKTYTGSAITQNPTVKVGDQTLTKDTDYTVSYANNTKVGTATVKITGKGNYTGTVSKTFKINGIPVSNATVSGISNKTYTGSAITQNPTVKVGDKTLKKGTDYTITYANNTNVGTATVTITGKGNYASKKNVTFKINKAAQSITAKAGASRVAVGKTTTVSITGNKGKKSYKSSNTAIATVTSAGKVTAKKVGTVKITATSAATANYKAASKTVTIKVVPAATASLTAANQVKGIKLTWKKVTGANGYKVYRGSTLIKTITSGSTVTFADTKANTNGTKYTYKVLAKATTGDSTLSKSRVIYRVSRPTVSAATNSASKKMTVKWGKNAKATGYQIQYSTDKNFKSGNKAVSITSASTVSKVIGSLTKGKTYYIRIRTYKTVGSTKYWSIWSTARSVKISK